MTRLFFFILEIAVLAAAALWLIDRYGVGTVHIVWNNTVIDSSAAFLAVVVLLLSLLLFFLFRLWHFLRHGPTHWRLNRKLNKMREGQTYLTDGLIAIAAGNATEAGRLAVAARKNTDNGIAALWLQAQAAQLAGDRRAARDIFRTLAAQPESAVLGYRGLITEARRGGDWPDVERLMDELYRVKPATPWLSTIRMESAARRQQWDEAESALSHAVAARLLDTEQGRHTRAALRIAAARVALQAGDKDKAMQAAEQAARLAPDWLPALINHAETLSAAGHRRATLRAVERAWKIQPHPQLAAILRRQGEDAMDGYKLTEKLCRTHDMVPESRLALADAALAADIWGEARRYLTESVAARNATQGVYKLLAKVERRERGDERAAAAWLSRGADAPADPAWLCQTCGGTHDQWQPVCVHCGAFNTLDWQSQGQSRKNVIPYIDNHHD